MTPRRYVSRDDGARAGSDEQDDRRTAGSRGPPARALHCARPVAVQNGGERAGNEAVPECVVLAALAVVAIVLASMAVFVDPTEQALILRFRSRSETSSARRAVLQVAVCRHGGLYRQAHLRPRQRAPGSAGVRQSAPGHAFVRYRIDDPLLFYQSVYNTRGADAQLGAC